MCSLGVGADIAISSKLYLEMIWNHFIVAPTFACKALQKWNAPA